MKNRSKNILETAMQKSSKISEIRCENGAKIHQQSIKNPSKNRGPKKDGPKSRKIEAWSAQGSKMSLRPSCGPRDFEPVGPYKPTKRTRIVFRWSHTPMGRWPGELLRNPHRACWHTSACRVLCRDFRSLYLLAWWLFVWWWFANSEPWAWSLREELLTSYRHSVLRHPRASRFFACI